ncbi:hypothetical protein [Acidianus sp. RZ1]|uniref:hypothetical protein n=1 Tax=Acidianus sp. RZ1 TaxID=1540082 RepID=UPI00149118E7|nr:hypothetical protein [Acidianus sp. RZ1]NON61756.1 hypothetical protein [Acidianus sp. RZ1]
MEQIEYSGRRWEIISTKKISDIVVNLIEDMDKPFDVDEENDPSYYRTLVIFNGEKFVLNDSYYFDKSYEEIKKAIEKIQEKKREAKAEIERFEELERTKVSDLLKLAPEWAVYGSVYVLSSW